MSTRLISAVTTAVASTIWACLGNVNRRVHDGAPDARRQLVWVDRAGQPSLLLHGAITFTCNRGYRQTERDSPWRFWVDKVDPRPGSIRSLRCSAIAS